MRVTVGTVVGLVGAGHTNEGILRESGTLVNLAVALGASHATNWLRDNARRAALLQRLTGLVFIGLGLRLALERRC